jgi:ADP-heptose:LPS heptosyltransferase
VVFFIIGDQKDKGSFFDNTKKNWVNLIGKTSIKDFFYLVNKMDFIVCNESAPAHIADEFEIPLLAFFIPDSGSRYHPISKSSRVIVSESEVDSIPLEVITSELDKILKRIKHENN